MIDKSKVIATALHGFGAENQKVKCIEELAELQKELCKDLIGQGSRFHVAEEIADVEILLEQMKIHYGISRDTEAIKAQKLKQLAQRLNIGVDEE